MDSSKKGICSRFAAYLSGRTKGNHTFLQRPFDGRITPVARFVSYTRTFGAAGNASEAVSAAAAFESGLVLGVNPSLRCGLDRVRTIFYYLSFKNEYKITHRTNPMKPRIVIAPPKAVCRSENTARTRRKTTITVIISRIGTV